MSFVETELEVQSTLSEEFMQAREDFAQWYDAKSKNEQRLIDEIATRTSYIIDEDEYEAFIEELDSYGITDASTFEDAFYGEVKGYGESVTADFAEQLIEDMDYSIQPDFIANCIDWELVWHSALRFDYNAVEFGGNTYFFSNNY